MSNLVLDFSGTPLAIKEHFMEGFMTLLLLLFLQFNLAVANAQSPSTSWTMDEMNPMKSGEYEHDKKIPDISCGFHCKFTLDYFRGKNVSGGKNILYISGGPGHIVRREGRDLE